MAKDNMYPWIDKKRNFIGGDCPHRCRYCFVNDFKKKYPQVKERYTGEPFLIEKELQKSEGKGHTIFVQDCGDLFAEAIPSEWILKVLEHCREYSENTYFFQSKNPMRFIEFIGMFPKRTLLGTTIESNRDYEISKAPSIMERVAYIGQMRERGHAVVVSIEPLMDFDEVFTILIKYIKPKFVSIGADSKGHNLPEPTLEKIMRLKEELEKFTKVKLKSNLKRLGVATNS